MGQLATIFPLLQRIRRLPLSRDQLMLLMAATNEIFLGIDTYLAHSISGTIRPYEWIPIIFGPIAGVLLLLAGLIALRRRPLATVIATATLLVSSVTVAMIVASGRRRRAMTPASSNSAPAIGPKMIGIHS